MRPDDKNTPRLPDKVIVHDSMYQPGGAEYVVSTILDYIKGFDLVTNDLNAEITRKYKDSEIALRKLGTHTGNPFFRNISESRNFRHKTGFLKDYDIAVFSGHNSVMGVFNRDVGFNALYCHALPRFIYDLKGYWHDRANLLERPFLNLLINYIRPRYEAALGRMDLIIANSANVQDRIQQYLGMESTVIHPPCDTEKYTWLSEGDYYLSTARLEPFKRVECIVKAFLAMPDKKLVVLSGGSEFDRLKTLAGTAPNIEFRGWVPDSEIGRMIGNCIATIYVPIDEDFGISPVESMAAGKPVIGVNEGGLRETVIDGVTGLLLEGANLEEGIVRAVERLDSARALSMRLACESNAERFSKQNFISNMENIISAYKADFDAARQSTLGSNRQ